MSAAVNDDSQRAWRGILRVAVSCYRVDGGSQRGSTVVIRVESPARVSGCHVSTEHYP